MKFQFPFKVDISKTKNPILRVSQDEKYMCDGINLLDYMSEKEIEDCKEIVVFNTKLTLYKGDGIYTPEQTFQTIEEPVSENSDRKLESEYVYIHTKEKICWNFSEMTSNYSKERNQHYVKIELEECTSELDVLSLAAGLGMYYGVHFTIHTVSESKGIYHLTIDSMKEDGYVDIFNDISNKKDEIYQEKALFVTVGVNKKNTESNSMPAPKYDWDW